MPIITPCPLSLPKEAFWILRISSMDKEYILNHDPSEAYEGIQELTPDEVLEIFEKRYKKYTPVFKIKEVHFKQIDGIQTEVY